jgi:hypothetical protein
MRAADSGCVYGGGKMTWDEAYNHAKEKLGREPKVAEVQERLLEMFGTKIQDAEKPTCEAPK